MSKDFNKKPRKEWTDQDFQEAYQVVMYDMMRRLLACQDALDYMGGWSLKEAQRTQILKLYSLLRQAKIITWDEMQGEMQRQFKAAHGVTWSQNNT